MKINQYCSVCKKHLDMDVIPTDDAGDDGVIWLRCPECQGFLPKFSGEGLGAPREPAAPGRDDPAAGQEPAGARPARRGSAATQDGAQADDRDPDADADETDRDGADADAGIDGEAAATATAAKATIAAEPLAEYAARLAAADVSRARPYRSTDTYAVDDLIHHLAYGDVGIVVAKEQLAGGRQIVKVFFEESGLMRLIEQAPADGR